MGLRILSLFDGMACGMLAFQGMRLKVDRYVAYEIDKFAIKTSTHNFPMLEHRGDVFDADFTEFENFDFLIGGSPCTYWSIAQKNNRETEASGMGWELFSQYVRALREAKPKFFIYENNKSMSNAIRESITKTFGFEPVLINSALVSAQNRQRLYWVGRLNDEGVYVKVEVEQPADRGILLRDILQTGWDLTMNDKSYALTASYNGAVPWNTIERNQRNMVAESVTVDKAIPEIVEKYGYLPEMFNAYNRSEIENKSPTLSTGSMVTSSCAVNKFEKVEASKPIRVGCMPSPDGTIKNSQALRVYSVDGKAVSQTAQGGGMGAKTGLYAVPECCVFDPPHGWNDGIITYGKFPNLTTGSACRQQNVLIEPLSESNKDLTKQAQSFCNKVYEVKDGLITIKDKQYSVKLPDGFYIIRKLTVRECMRLQTVPEWYEFPVSDSQAYKMLGNGWTVEVIIHLIKSIINDFTNHTIFNI